MKDIILVTGAEGFIGSHLAGMLLDEGHRVRALVQYNSFNSLGWLNDIRHHKSLEIVTGDVRDPFLCRDIVKGTSLVYNLAALIAIPYSYRAPESYFETNVRGVINICNAARENGNTRVLHVSTSEVYGTAQYVPIDEKHPKQPQSPYSASKIAADAAALSFSNSFGLPVVVARPFNTYGPRQSARAVIPTIITQILNGVTEIKLGDTSPRRDFNYVTDTCRGLKALAGCDEALGKEVNISSGTEISIGELFETIASILKSDAVAVVDKERLRPATSEVYRLCGDNSLIRSLTGYDPEYDLRKGLEVTCKWFTDRENLRNYTADLYNI